VGGVEGPAALEQPREPTRAADVAGALARPPLRLATAAASRPGGSFRGGRHARPAAQEPGAAGTGCRWPGKREDAAHAAQSPPGVSALVLDLGEGARSSWAAGGAGTPGERVPWGAFSEPPRLSKAEAAGAERGTQPPALLPTLPGTSSGSIAWSIRMARSSARRSALAAVF